MHKLTFKQCAFLAILLLPLFALVYSHADMQAVNAGENLSARLAGRILIQPEANGEAWYVSPMNHRRYFLGRPKDAFHIMEEHGMGVTIFDLEKIRIGLMNHSGEDKDGDGLIDRLEKALRTDPEKKDSDNDGYDDLEEIKNGYDPLGPGSLDLDEEFFNKHAGKIFLQIEDEGEAWYLDPVSRKRFYLSTPSDAFAIMKKLALGISDKDIGQIPIGTVSPVIKNPPLPVSGPVCKNCESTSASKAVSGAGSALIDLDLKELKKYISADMHKAMELMFEYQDDHSIAALGGLLNKASLYSSSADSAAYKTYVYADFTGNEAEIIFQVNKEEDGVWRLSGL